MTIENERRDETGAAPGAQPEDAPTEVLPPPAGTEPGRRRLVRSRDDRVLAGVCGGLAEYLGVDAVLVRIAALVLVFAGGAGIVLYVVGWIAMPEAPAGPTGTAEPSRTQVEAGERTSGAAVLGLVFVVLGAFFLVDEIWPDLFSWQYVWPVALIAIGVAILLRPRR